MTAHPALLPEAIAFQGALEEIVASPPPAWMRRANLGLVGALLALILTASLTHVDIVVSAGGSLAADQPSIAIQPMERAMVRYLRVKPGDTVEKDEILAALDPTFSQSSLESQMAQHHAFTVLIARLEAEAGGASPGTARPSDPDAALQADLHQERRVQFAARLTSLDEAIQRGEAALLTAEQDHAALRRQLAVARDLEAMRAKLFNAQIGSRLLLLEAQGARLRVEREAQATQNRMVELRHDLNGRRAERTAFVGGARADLLQDIARARAELTKVEDALTKANRLPQLIVLTAPEDAIVLDIAARPAGSILREAEPLMTLLPTRAALIADVFLDSQDVGYVRAGDPVAIKVDAFPYQRHGLLRGTVRSVGHASVNPDQRANRDAASQPGRFHRMQVALHHASLTSLPEGTRLNPGMTLTAEVKVGVRTAISYFLNPITRGFDETIREP